MKNVEPKDGTIIAVLKKRDGLPTVVVTRSGERYHVMNVAWGYNLGDHYALLTTNMSPTLEGEKVEAFYTEEILEIKDAETGYTIFSLE